jgi:hypothetical protein
MSKREDVDRGKGAVDVEPDAVDAVDAVASGEGLGVDPDEDLDEVPVLGAGLVPDADRVLDRHGPGTRVRSTRRPLRPNALELA